MNNFIFNGWDGRSKIECSVHPANRGTHHPSEYLPCSQPTHPSIHFQQEIFGINSSAQRLELCPVELQVIYQRWGLLSMVPPTLCAQWILLNQVENITSTKLVAARVPNQGSQSKLSFGHLYQCLVIFLRRCTDKWDGLALFSCSRCSIPEAWSVDTLGTVRWEPSSRQKIRSNVREYHPAKFCTMLYIFPLQEYVMMDRICRSYSLERDGQVLFYRQTGSLLNGRSSSCNHKWKAGMACVELSS